MRTHKTYYNNTSFLDVLFCTLLLFVLLFAVSFLMIAPEKNKAKIETKAEYVITVTWDPNSDDDVDTWLEDPNGNIAWFRKKDIGLMHLDRDDLGTKNDRVTLADGSVITHRDNREIMTIRGFIPGEWILNVHMFNKLEKEPAVVSVRVDKLNPKVKMMVFKKITLMYTWHEVTVKRFTLSAEGDITNMNDLQKDLVERRVEQVDMEAEGAI